MGATLGLAGLLVTGSAVMLWMNRTTLAGTNPLDVATPYLFAAYVPVGAVILRRNPGHGVGRLFVLVGLWAAFAVCAQEYGILALTGPWSIPAGRGALNLSQTLAASVLLPAGWLLLLYPDGRLPSLRWRPYARVLSVVSVTSVFLAVAFPESGGAFRTVEIATTTQPDPLDDLVWLIGTIVNATVVAGSVTAAVVRFRAASHVTREQMKWMAYAPTLGLLALAVSAAPLPVIGEFHLVAGVVLALGVPVAAANAILRHRLYDIDRILSRTVGYALVASVVVAAYAAPVVLLPRLLGESSDLIIAGSTLAAAAVFNPARRRIQRAVDHRFDRTRYDGEREVDALANRLRGEVDLGTVTEDLSGVLGRTIAPATSSIWLRDNR
jgi:hypothetical protein